MEVESGVRVSNTWVTYLHAGDNPLKSGLIPYMVTILIDVWLKVGTFGPAAWRSARALLACWWGNCLPRQRWVADLRG